MRIARSTGSPGVPTFARGSFESWRTPSRIGIAENARRPVELQLDEVEAELDAFAFEPDCCDPAQRLIAQSMADAVRAALGTLPQDSQLVIQLCCLEGFAYREIAEILGCPVGTVMSRLHRARQALRQRLATDIDVPARRGPGDGERHL